MTAAPVRVLLHHPAVERTPVETILPPGGEEPAGVIEGVDLLTAVKSGDDDGFALAGDARRTRGLHADLFARCRPRPAARSRATIDAWRRAMSLFDEAAAQAPAPLAARLRPRSLDEFVGQAHLVGAGRALRTALDADQVHSLILWGPPGTGKTSLALIIAARTRSHVEQVNAVAAGVADR